MISPTKFQKLVLDWFGLHGRKHLPWQQQKTPYRVWISEIMLQQTQVNTVIPYFERFMQRFPDLSSLAKAENDEVMHMWAGLGYYSRARNLHRAAKLVVENYHGAFPDKISELQKLPGIGQSTAGAILAIAFNKSATILDGNVKRVLARFHGISAPINEKKVENKLWELASKYTPKKSIADYTQAMMDLGATLCTPKKPQCDFCPLKKDCCAHRQGIADELPRKKPARKLLVRAQTFLIIQCGQYVLLRKRSPLGIWGNLWSLPEVPGKPQKKLVQTFCHQNFNFKPEKYIKMPGFRHTFSHFHLDIFPLLISIKNKICQIREADQIWYNLKSPQRIGLPRPVELLLKKLK